MCNYEAFAESRTKCDYDSYFGILHAFLGLVLFALCNAIVGGTKQVA